MARNRRCPGYLVKRYRSWRWVVSVGGKYHRFTIRADTKREAEDWARRKYEELVRQVDRVRRGIAVGVRMSDLLNYFETERLPRLAPGTQAAYIDSLKPIEAYFVERLGDPRVEDVRTADIADYLDWRRLHGLRGDKPLHNRTLAKDRAVLHRIFEVAIQREWREGNPVARVPVEKYDARQPVILSDEEYERLLAAIRDPMVRTYVLFCGETGARCESEALWVKWEDVDLEAGFVTIVSGRDGHRVKGGKTRYVPLTPRLKEALREHFARYRFASYDGRRPEYVFHHTTAAGRCVPGQRVKSFYDAVRNAAKRAGLPEDWRMHDLRHRRATTWLAEGKSPVLVKEALGHTDLRVTMNYTHLAREHLRALVEPDTGATGHKRVIYRAE
ncbi:MAG: integrase [Gemmatimonadales bacterium]|nr:MAG: integrase [Gemmatimonadales bacterium]